MGGTSSGWLSGNVLFFGSVCRECIGGSSWVVYTDSLDGCAILVMVCRVLPAMFLHLLGSDGSAIIMQGIKMH